jgi:pimeloyl-ACP methyl ester carboxylesterase
MANDALEIMQRRVGDLRGLHIIDGAGHFVQQERAEVFNRALVGFLETL